METVSLLALCAGNSPVTGEFPSQWPVKRTLMFSLISAWANGWVNNQDAGDLMRHRVHYDVTVIVVACGTEGSHYDKLISHNLNQLLTNIYVTRALLPSCILLHVKINVTSYNKVIIKLTQPTALLLIVCASFICCILWLGHSENITHC